MKPFEKGVQASMFDLISSGVRGAMTNGDTYGIWLANGENDMSFKMEVWRDKFKVEMGARSALHVKEHGYSGKLNLRLSKDLHRRLALESSAQGVSLNNWITTKLARS